MKRSRSYIKTPEWLQNKKATINPKNINDDNCFQYSITLVLEDIGRYWKRSTNNIKNYTLY